MPLHENLKEEVTNRLRRIEGQVRGIQRLVDQGAHCRKVAAQIKAARTALDAAGKLVLACYLADSINSDDMNENEAIDMIIKF